MLLSRRAHVFSNSEFVSSNFHTLFWFKGKKYKIYTPICKNIAIEKSKKQKPKWKKQVGINKELIITDEDRSPEKKMLTLFLGKAARCMNISKHQEKVFQTAFELE